MVLAAFPAFARCEGIVPGEKPQNTPDSAVMREDMATAIIL